MKKALIVIDMQHDFIDGALGSEDAKAIVPFVKNLIDKRDYNKLVFTRDTHFENYMETQEGKHLPVPHCIKDTYGWEIHPELDTTNATIIDKYSFGYDKWQGHFDGMDEIILTGLCTDICVISNALILKALYPETNISIVKNATAGVTPATKDAALATAQSCQIQIM